jgi:hypothetical protein
MAHADLAVLSKHVLSAPALVGDTIAHAGMSATERRR